MTRTGGHYARRVQVMEALEGLQKKYAQAEARADARAEQARLDKLEAAARAEQAVKRAEQAAERAEQARKALLAVQQAQLEENRRLRLRLLDYLAKTITSNKPSVSENA